MWQFITRVSYLWREMVLGLRRGGSMNWAAICTTAVLLFLFGTSLQVSWQLENLANQFGSQLRISVYLDPGASVESLAPVAARFPQVTDVIPVSKEDAWQELVRDLGLADIAGATELLQGNPLVDELQVKVRSPAAVPIVVERLSQIPGVEEVIYGDRVLDQLKNLNRGIGHASLIVTALLTMSAIAVIATTIRLIVVARTTEIEIMQLVGATKVWIVLPFLLQGVVFGLIGGAIAWVSISSLQQFFNRLLASQLEFLQFLTSVPGDRYFILPLILLSFGALVGWLGSWFAVRPLALK